MDVTLNGTEGEIITITSAKEAMLNYQFSSTFIANNGIKGFLFGKDHIENILSQEECIGIRIYYGYSREVNNSLLPQLIIVGTDGDGNDILNSDLILDTGLPCPRLCPPETALDD